MGTCGGQYTLVKNKYRCADGGKQGGQWKLYFCRLENMIFALIRTCGIYHWILTLNFIQNFLSIRSYFVDTWTYKKPGSFSLRSSVEEFHNKWNRVWRTMGTVCPRSSYPFYLVSYYMKWVTTSWTFSSLYSFYVVNYDLKLVKTSRAYTVWPRSLHPVISYCLKWAKTSGTYRRRHIQCF
mgnify:CR=1 FL=1